MNGEPGGSAETSGASSSPAATSASRTTSWWLRLALIVGSFAALGWIAWSGYPALSEQPLRIAPGRLAAALGAYSVAVLSAAYGWHLIVRDLGGSTSIGFDVRAFLLSLAARRLPGGIWGLAGRLFLYRQTGTGGTATLALVVEGVVIIGSALVLALPLGVLTAAPVAGATYVAGLVGLATLALALQPAILGRALDWAGARIGAPAPRVAGRSVAGWLLAYSVVWLAGGLVLYFVCDALTPVAPSALPAIVAAWVLAGVASSLVYFVPGGLGITELALTALLTATLPGPTAVAAALVMRAFTTAGDLLWTGVAILAGGRLGSVGSRPGSPGDRRASAPK
ncbi:MAG: flippase-like domain-containing protein [Chloroflexi bacterium]|nr:flippase-like domain-containing protein [Chloroflexota bacterium]